MRFGRVCFSEKEQSRIVWSLFFLLEELLTSSARKKIRTAADTAADLFSEILPRCTAHVLDFSMDLVVLQ